MGRRELSEYKSILDPYDKGNITEEPYEFESLTYGSSTELVRRVTAYLIDLIKVIR